MLVLTRKKGETIVIDAYDSGGQRIRIDVMVVDVYMNKVRVGVTAPRSIPVHRLEIYEVIAAREAMELATGRASASTLTTAMSPATSTAEVTAEVTAEAHEGGKSDV